MPESKMSKQGNSESENGRFSVFTRRTLEVLALIALAFFLWQVKNMLLLLFLGILLAVFLSRLAGKLSAHTPLPRQAALAVVGLLILALLALSGWFFESQIAQQTDQLGRQLQQSIDRLRQYQWGQYLGQNVPSFSEIAGGGGGGVFSRITGVASRLINVITNILIVVFLGAYLSVKPALYREGAVKLLPKKRRPRAREALGATGHVLWMWLLATFVSMAIIGALSWLGLMLLGIPLAATLGLIAGLLEFIPLIGPFLAAVPAVLVAFLQGPTQALYVALLYLGIQQVESYLVTPLVQEQGTSLPPALTLLAAIAFGLLFGPLGVIVATPLMVAIMVLTKMLYVEDVLKTPTSIR